MFVAKPVGREAATKKYDILTALASFALSQDKHKQRQVMRLMALITSRYNWQRDELSMGQKEIARLWSVDTRTVKREIAKFKSLGWMTQKRTGARGRVSVYGLDLTKIVQDTQPAWANVGPDFVERLSVTPVEIASDNVVPFRLDANVSFQDGFWGDVCRSLNEEDPAIYKTWIAQLVFATNEQGQVTLIAPSRFHANYVSNHLAERIRTNACRIDPSVRLLNVIPN